MDKGAFYDQLLLPPQGQQLSKHNFCSQDCFLIITKSLKQLSSIGQRPGLSDASTCPISGTKAMVQEGLHTHEEHVAAAHWFLLREEKLFLEEG